MQSEASLLTRCKENIVELKKVVISQKEEIQKLERDIQILKVQLQQSNDTNHSLMQEKQILKQAHNEQKSKLTTEVINLQRKLIHQQCENDFMAFENQKKIKSLEAIELAQKQQLQQNAKLIEQWERTISEIATKISKLEEDKELSQNQHKLEKEKLISELTLSKQEIQQLHIQCDALHHKQEASVADIKRIANQFENLAQQIQKYSKEIKQKIEQNYLLQQQNYQHQKQILEQSKTIKKYEDHIINLQSQINRLNKILTQHKITRNYSKEINEGNEFKELVKLQQQTTPRKQTSNENRLSLPNRVNKFQATSFKQNDPLLLESVAPKPVEFQFLSEYKKSKKETLTKMEQLQTHVKSIMKEIRQDQQPPPTFYNTYTTKQ